MRNHDKAEALVASDKRLTNDEVEFVLDHYRPDVNFDVMRAGMFFTPRDLALDVALVASGDESSNLRIIDLCAGIGRLTWAMMVRHNNGGHYVAVERNHRLVEVGKRVLPDVTWIQGDVLDKGLIESLGMFDIAISNPPFGKVPSDQDRSWLNYKGSNVDLAVCDIIPKITKGWAYVILPASSIPWDRRTGEKRIVEKELVKWQEANPDLRLNRTSVDPSLYQFDGTNVLYDIAEIAYEGTGDLRKP